MLGPSGQTPAGRSLICVDTIAQVGVTYFAEPWLSTKRGGWTLHGREYQRR
jgi:hypothetical protein